MNKSVLDMRFGMQRRIKIPLWEGSFWSVTLIYCTFPSTRGLLRRINKREGRRVVKTASMQRCDSTWEKCFFFLVINQLDAQNLFYNKFISCLYMFRASFARRQEVKILLYSLWYHHTYRWPSGSQVVHGTTTYRCVDTRGCIIQFWPPDDERMMLETCRGMK